MKSKLVPALLFLFFLGFIFILKVDLFEKGLKIVDLENKLRKNNELNERENEKRIERKISIDEAYENLERKIGKLLDSKVWSQCS